MTGGNIAGTRTRRNKDSGVDCWGSNQYGQLGTSVAVGGSWLSPIYAMASAYGEVAIAAGDYHTCVTYSSGALKCWGNNQDGQLGVSLAGSSYSPPANLLDSSVLAAAAGQRHTCALLMGGALKCWGYNGYLQLGSSAAGGGTYTPQAVPLAVGVKATAVAAGAMHACALTNDGQLRCWGEEDVLGDGTLGATTGAAPQVVCASGSAGCAGGAPLSDAAVLARGALGVTME
jgi:alpha-tubulin suppressor-like RCC1 family protein